MKELLLDYSDYAIFNIVICAILGVLISAGIWKIEKKFTVVQILLVACLGVFISIIITYFYYGMDTVDVALMKGADKPSSRGLPLFYVLIIACGLKLFLNSQKLK